MSWTKRKLVEMAYAELALSGWVFDLEPEELNYALMRLETMMATWAGQGVQVGYVLTTGENDADLDQDSGLQMIAVEAVFLNLAARIAANKGKTLQPSTLRNAKQAYDTLITTVAKAQVKEQQLAAGTPRGQGRKPWRTINPYCQAPDTTPLHGDAKTGLDFNGLGN